MLGYFLLYSRVIQLYIYIFFFLFFSIMTYHRVLDIAPCALHGTLMFIHSMGNSLHLLIPSSQPIPPLLFPLATTGLFSTSLSQFLFHRRVHLRHSSDPTYEGYRMVSVFLRKEQWMKVCALHLRTCGRAWSCVPQICPSDTSAGCQPEESCWRQSCSGDGL